jgi:hypothetical protein
MNSEQLKKGMHITREVYPLQKLDISEIQFIVESSELWRLLN